MNEEMKESLRELGASEAVIQSSGGDLLKAIELGGMGRKLVRFGSLYLHDQAGSNFAIPPFDKEEFVSFFRRAAFNIPAEYLDFLIKTNGGNVGNKVTFPLRKSRRKIVQFLSFKPSIFHLPQIWLYRTSSRPLFLLEFAVDSKSDYIVIKLASRSPSEGEIPPGSIWHLTSQAAASLADCLDQDVIKSKSCLKIADSFNEFIGMLKCETGLPSWLQNKEVFEER